jgi:hypothetical protein
MIEILEAVKGKISPATIIPRRLRRMKGSGMLEQHVITIT